MIKKIDTHIHLASPDLTQSIHQSLTVSDVFALYEMLNIEKGIVLCGSLPGAVSNEQALELCKRYPDRFARFAYISLDKGVEKAVDEVKKAYETGAKGVGEFVDNVYLDSPEMDTLLSACEKYGMPFLFHMSDAIGHSYGIVDDVGLPALEHALKAHPNLKFIGHSPCFWSEISANVVNRTGYPFGPVEREGRVAELLRTYPNLYCDLSANSASNALMRDSLYGISFLKEFHQRLFFATDSLLCPLGPWLDILVQQGALTESEYANIVRENALRELKLA